MRPLRAFDASAARPRSLFNGYYHYRIVRADPEPATLPAAGGKIKRQGICPTCLKTHRLTICASKIIIALIAHGTDKNFRVAYGGQLKCHPSVFSYQPYVCHFNLHSRCCLINMTDAKLSTAEHTGIKIVRIIVPCFVKHFFKRIANFKVFTAAKIVIHTAYT